MQLRNKNIVPKGILLIIGFLGMAWFLILFITHGIINIGNITGILVFFCVLLYGFRMSHINNMFVKAWNNLIGKIILSIIGLCVVIIAGITIILSIFMIETAVQKPSENSTAIVLGCRVYEERAGLMLIERLDAAYSYLSENEDSVCVLSGGQGPGEKISEAECMYRYLIDKGIASERLYKEEMSTSTRENLAFSKKIIEQYNLNPKVAIVTNEFHGYRARKVADSLGLESSAVSGKTAWWLFPTYYVRELYGIIYEWLL